MAQVLTFRRTAFAVFTGLVALLLTGGVLGFAAADPNDGSGGVPTVYELEPPRVGDRGTYSMIQLHAEDGTLVAKGPEARVLEFEWEAGRRMLDRHGIQHFVHPLTYLLPTADKTQSFSWGEGSISTSNRQGEKTDYYDLFSGALVAHRATYEGSTQISSVTIDTNTNYTTFRDRHVAPAPGAPGCGTRNAFHVSSISLAEPVRLFPDCHIEYRIGTSPAFITIQGTFKAVALERIDAVEAIVFEQETDGRFVHVWFRKDIPYPIQFAVTHRGGDHGELIRLSGFHRGAEAPLSRSAPSPVSVAPALVWAPRNMTGPSEQGIAHPFPLSVAFEHAIASQDGSRLRNFAGEHPDATLLAARYNAWTDESYRYRDWRFRVADETASLEVSVTHQTNITRVPPGNLLSLVPSDSYSVEYPETKYSGLGRTLFASDVLPKTMPTVQSLMNQWTAYTDSAETPNSWGFSHQCWDKACTKPRLQVYAGFTETNQYQQTGLAATAATSDQLASRTDELQLVFDPGSLSPSSMTRTEYESRREMSGFAPLALSSSEGRSVSPESYAGVWWTIPTGNYAVGAGLFAFLIGFTYWIWPAIRHVVGFGLFSRLEKPMLLQHPVRQEIVSVVEANPGIHFAEIVRRVGAGNGNTEHHLRHLVTRKILGEVEAKGFTCYYVPGTIGADSARALPALKSRGARAILSAIAAKPGLRAQDVARAIGMSEPTVHYHLVRLREVGLVDAKRGANGLELRATSTAAVVLPIAA